MIDAVYPILSAEERESIIKEAVERTLLSLPDVIGNIMASHATMLRDNKKFYDAYPEFKDHKGLVVSVMETIEGRNPFITRDKLEEKAVPEIRKRIPLLKKLDQLPTNGKPDLGAL